VPIDKPIEDFAEEVMQSFRTAVTDTYDKPLPDDVLNEMKQQLIADLKTQ
jgi:hypothetical protein